MFTVWLEKDGDDGHCWLDDTELKSPLFTEPWVKKELKNGQFQVLKNLFLYFNQFNKKWKFVEKDTKNGTSYLLWPRLD